MIRSYKVEKEYLTGKKNGRKKINYTLEMKDTSIETTSGMIDVSMKKQVPVDIDIFSELPRDIYNNTKVAFFLSELKEVILSTDLENVTLSKLHVSEFDEETLTLEWIFNYFRAYFSFDLTNAQNEDSYGMIENNPDFARFSNFFRELKISEYKEVAESVVAYILMMGGFKTDDSYE